MSAALVWAVPCQAGLTRTVGPPRSRAMTSGFQLHGYPEPLQSGTGDAAMIGGRGRTEVRGAVSGAGTTGSWKGSGQGPALIVPSVPFLNCFLKRNDGHHNVYFICIIK